MSNVLFASIKADFKQRIRQSSFPVTLLVMALLAVLFFPAPTSEYQTLLINGYRGIYNSAWVGLCLVSLNVVFLPIICFYLVKNTVNNDRLLLVSELIAATPVSKTSYLAAKWLVSVAILSSVVIVMIAISVFMQLYFGESYQVNLWQIVWPQLVFVLPLLFAISAIALLFETIPWLRGGLGNVAYFFIWVTSIAQLITSGSGIAKIHDQVQQDLYQIHPHTKGDNSVSVGASSTGEITPTFVWDGIALSSDFIVGALPILAIGIVAFTLAVTFFDRFANTAVSSSKTSSSFIDNKLTAIGSLADKLLLSLTNFSSFTRQMRLELLLMLKGLSKYWYLAIIGVNIAQVAVPMTTLNTVVIPLSWLLCVLVLSPIGIRSRLANTQALMGYCNFSIQRQALSVVSAATLLLLLTTSGALVRMLVTGEWLIALQMLIATSFISALAFALSSLTKTTRTFEVIYPALWYVGPAHAMVYFDYFGVKSSASWQANMPIYTLVAAVLLFAVGLLKSRRNYAVS